MRIVRYFFVGAAAAAVDIGLFTFFVYALHFDYFVVGACTFVVATAVNYALSVQHVFQSGARFRRRDEIALVFAVSAVGILVNQGFLYAGVSMLGLPALVAKLMATGGVFLWNYWARAHFVFKARAPR